MTRKIPIVAAALALAGALFCVPSSWLSSALICARRALCPSISSAMVLILAHSASSDSICTLPAFQLL